MGNRTMLCYFSAVANNCPADVVHVDGDGSFFTALGGLSLFDARGAKKLLTVFSPRARYERTLINFLDSGVRMDVILTDPAGEGVQAWEKVRRGRERRLRVYNLADLYSAEEWEKVGWLTEYHPSVIRGADGRVAAWLEGCHPKGSPIAYGVDFCAPDDVAKGGAFRTRIEKELGILQNLIPVKLCIS